MSADVNEVRLTGTVDRVKPIQTRTGQPMAEVLLKVRQDRFRVVAHGNVAEHMLVACGRIAIMPTRGMKADRKNQPPKQGEKMEKQEQTAQEAIFQVRLRVIKMIETEFSNYGEISNDLEILQTILTDEMVELGEMLGRVKTRTIGATPPCHRCEAMQGVAKPAAAVVGDPALSISRGVSNFAKCRRFP